MPTSIITQGSYSPTVTTNYTYTGTYFPSGILPGESLVWVGTYGTLTSITDNLSGTWTQLAACCWYKRAIVGTETSVTITQSGTTHGIILRVGQFAGAGGTPTTATTTGTSLTVSGMYTVGQGIILVYQKGSSTGGAIPAWGTPAIYSTVIASANDDVASPATRAQLSWRGSISLPFTGKQSSASSSITSPPSVTTRTMYMFQLKEANQVGGLALKGIGV